MWQILNGTVSFTEVWGFFQRRKDWFFYKSQYTPRRLRVGRSHLSLIIYVPSGNLTVYFKKKRMQRAILNKSWRQQPTRHQLYGHLPPITKTFQVRRTRHAGHCWRSRDELISDVLLWTPTHGRAKAGRPARTYIQQLCEDTGCCSEDLPEAMNDREKWRERVRDIRATSTTWWWWRWLFKIIFNSHVTVHSTDHKYSFLFHFVFMNFELLPADHF